MEHRLKTLPEYFWDVAAGRKQFEVRKDDREPPYKPNDTLLLEEWAGNRYTGKWIRAHVDLVLRGEYCKDGYCIMSITRTEGNGLAPPTNADRIRAMSDEELAEFIRDCESAGYNDEHITPKGADGYHIDTLDWLTQPAEED